MNNNDIIRVLFVSDDEGRFNTYIENNQQYIKEFNDVGFPPVSHLFISISNGISSDGGLYAKLKELASNTINTHVIIDSNVIRENNEYGKVIQSLILEYPEVNFFFQTSMERGCQNKLESVADWLFPKTNYEKEAKKKKLIYFPDKNYSMLERLYKECEKVLDNEIKYEASLLQNIKFYKRKESSDIDNLVVFKADLQKYLAKQSVDFTFHDASDIYLLLLKDNLFDASNLRNAIIQWRQAEMHTKCNYKMTLNSRSHYLAHVVEEERNQCYYNSYMSFANGYRVLPIFSARLLKSVKLTNKQLIIRDYDLQFKDEISNPNLEGGNEIDFIRGYQIFDGGKITTTINTDNEYWDSTDYSKENIVFFITYGQDGIKIKNTALKPEINDNTLFAPGQYKPVIGIYYTHNNITPLKERKKATIENSRIFLKREKHLHGVPLDLYDIADSLLDRAIDYYKREKFIYAAVLSQEALLILNCFHMTLSLKAYHIHSISENAIALNVIGGKEMFLAEDASMRCKYIRQDINRLIALDKDSSNKDNILNQIFTDCRLFCKEKEHFLAEEVFIRELAHINDGQSIITLVKKLFKK